MEAQCPSCKARYRVKLETVPAAGLKVVCPKCKSPFFINPESQSEKEPPPQQDSFVLETVAEPNQGPKPVQPMSGKGGWLSWILGVMFFLAGLSGLAISQFLSALFYFVAALVLIPPLAEKLNLSLSGKIKALIAVGCLLGAGYSMSLDSKKTVPPPAAPKAATEVKSKPKPEISIREDPQSYEKTTPQPREVVPNNAHPGDVEQFCRNKWGNNYKMVEYCAKSQRAAGREIEGYSGTIRSNCENKWGQNLEMVLYCIKTQSSAKRSVDATVDDEVTTACKNKWGTNYEMVEYCIKNQQAARSAVTTAPRDEISAFCSRKWGQNYEMLEYCIKNQTAAKDNIIRNYHGPKRDICERKWGVNYEMVEYCIKN